MVDNNQAYCSFLEMQNVYDMQQCALRQTKHKAFMNTVKNAKMAYKISDSSFLVYRQEYLYSKGD